MNNNINFKYIDKIILLIIIYNWNNLYNFLFYKNSYRNNFYNLYITEYNNKFIIIKYNCRVCGLFTIYVNFLNCINTFINKGYIPIIDLNAYPNIFNKFNSSNINKNPWEEYFHQPLGFSLEQVKANSKNIIYLEYNNYNKTICKSYGIANYFFKNKVTLEYWHNIALKYIPIKTIIFNESIKIFKKLFKNNKNILGILLRGTDYISRKPKGHSIQPTPELVINDVIEMDKKNNYNYFFITTEDEIILNKFIKKFGKKLKYNYQNFIYNYKEKNYICYNENILGNINFQKTYLINIIILSNCIDIITSQTNGFYGAMILSNGFRHSKIYDLGRYKN